MANASKNKGTAFETAVCRYMRSALGDDSIERRALHGSQDMGDLYGIRAHGWDGIAECKNHKCVTAGLIERWRDETLCERGNADAGAALLVVSVYRAPVGRSEVHVTLRDLARIALPVAVCDGHMETSDGKWVRMSLEEACALIKGE